MGALTELYLYSEKQRSCDSVVEVGLGESISAYAEVKGIAVSDEKVIFELRSEDTEAGFTVVSVAGNVMTISGATLPVNKYKNKWININTALAPRYILKARSNTATTITFAPNIDLSVAPYSLVGGETGLITNIVKWCEKAIVPDDATVNTEGDSEVVFRWSMGEQWMGTSRVFGDYTLRAYWKGHEAGPVPEPDTILMEIVIISVWQMKEVYMAGVPQVIENPDYYTSSDPTTPEYIDLFPDDDLFRMAINMAIDEFERTTGLFLWPRKVVSNPEADEEHDIAVSPMDLWNRESWLLIRLRHKFVQSVENIEGWWGGSRVFTWNPDWYSQTLKGKIGLIQMVPKIGGLPFPQQNLISMDFIARIGPVDHVPGFWHVDYTAGWNERTDPIPFIILKLVGQTACVFLAAIWGDALSPGIASSSVSLDGVSESESKTASAIYGLFSAKIQQFQKDNEKLHRSIRESIIGLPMSVM